MDVKLITSYAMKFIGTPYIYGGNNPLSGMDCSGYVNEILKAFGILQYHEDLTAQELFVRLGKSYGPTEPTEGSILFFGPLANSIIHVAYAVNGKIMIEAGGGGSQTTVLDIAKRKGAFVRVRPISIRRDYLIGILPSYEG